MLWNVGWPISFLKLLANTVGEYLHHERIAGSGLLYVGECFVDHCCCLNRSVSNPASRTRPHRVKYFK